MISLFTESDYINASYIRDYRGEQSFIASQAPRVCTIDDMWRMIWQEHVNVIVMLTNLMVNLKIGYHIRKRYNINTLKYLYINQSINYM